MRDPLQPPTISPEEVRKLANHEADIERAAKTGDPVKVASAYEAYKKSMDAANQNAKPLSSFIK